MTTLTAARSRVAATALAVAAAGSLTACSTAGEGAVSGAGVGALTGLVLGSFSGEAGEGAVIGTAVGAVAGGVLGDQNERNARYSREQADAYHDARRDRDMYRRGADKHSGWGDRYDDRRSSADREYDDDRGSYEVRTETVVKRRSSPRVIIRYGDRHSRGYYRSHRPYRYWSRYSYCR